MSHSRDDDRSPNRGSSQNLLTVWRRKVRVSGVRQIERAIADVDAQLASDAPLIDQLILAGQRRELHTARWLVQWLLKDDSAPSMPELPETNPAPTPDGNPVLQAASERVVSESPAVVAQTIAGSIQSPPIQSPPIQSLQAALFQTTVAKLHNGLPNLTNTALEIDFLKAEKKRELLHIVLQMLQASLEALRLSSLTAEQLVNKRAVILQDVWQASVTAFFGKYYTVQIESQSIEVVEILLHDRAIVETAILDNIPLFPEFLSHLLFQTPLIIDDTDYAAGSVEAMARMELLLQNAMFQIANAVMQPLLNRFSDVLAIKQTFYDKRLLSSREIERFRNHLSWHYRTDRLFIEPAAIFESQYRLLILTDDGISKTTIYAPRNDELEQLSGIPFLVTLLLEIRDAIAPRLRAALSFLGKGVVYVLTEIIGRSIGLIGRGIIKGIGSALQDAKPRRSERWR